MQRWHRRGQWRRGKDELVRHERRARATLAHEDAGAGRAVTQEDDGGRVADFCHAADPAPNPCIRRDHWIATITPLRRGRSASESATATTMRTVAMTSGSGRKRLYRMCMSGAMIWPTIRIVR